VKPWPVFGRVIAVAAAAYLNWNKQSCSVSFFICFPFSCPPSADEVNCSFA
jgi:hypothetical protein